MFVSHNLHPHFEQQSQHQSNHRLHSITNKDTTAVLVFAVLVSRTTCHTLSYILHRCSFGDDECVFCSINVTRSMVVRKTCCPGIRHAYMGLCLLNLYLLCCVHGQDTSDFGEKEERDRCPKHQFWCRTWHSCDCAYFSLDDSECCQKCGWGQYREEPPDNACKPCPDDTLFTDYKWDPRTKHPCLGCGDAFGMLEDYTKKRGWSPKHYEAYSNDFSHQKELQCIADMTKKCTDKERKLADVMVVSYSEASGRTSTSILLVLFCGTRSCALTSPLLILTSLLSLEWWQDGCATVLAKSAVVSEKLLLGKKCLCCYTAVCLFSLCLLVRANGKLLLTCVFQSS